ncbi:MAG: hypothetical protein JWP81_2147 [Ferruginibacter sp.]|nr:hypothetical protein [Ferruginibacter sp.]
MLKTQHNFHQNKEMTRTTIQQLSINRFGSVQHFSKRFSKHIDNLYPDIRPWNSQMQAQ